MIRKRGKKWYYRTKQIVDGQIKEVEKVGGRTKKECEIALAKARIRFVNNESEICTITINEFSEIWLDEYVSECSYNTQKSYSSIMKKHILPVLGNMKLSEVFPMNVQQLLNAKKELSHNTLNQIYNTLRCMFKYAIVPCGYLKYNPALGIKVPNSRHEVHQTITWSEDDLEMIFTKFPKGHDFYIALQLMYHTGCRIGEALALKWEDVDLRQDTLFIHSTMLETGEISMLTKTKSSTRTVYFSSKLHDVLQERWQEQQVLAEMLNVPFKMVCCRNNARKLTAKDFRFFNMWAKKELGHGTLHTFRHTHATMLLEAGETLEMVSKRLGHSNLNTTAKVYSHILEKRNNKLLSVLETF